MSVMSQSPQPYHQTKSPAPALPQYFVYVVESPAPSDLLDGRTEGRLLQETLRLSGIACGYALAADLDCFKRALWERLAVILRNHLPQGIPILHFSAHGDEDCIQLTSGELLSWAQLADLLAPLNRILGGQLVVCMSTCRGSSACRMAMDEFREPPFLALVGNSGTPTWEDTAVAYVTFYHRFFRGDGVAIQQIINAMKTASGDLNFSIISGQDAKRVWVDAEQQRRFREALQSILRQRQTPPAS